MQKKASARVAAILLLGPLIWGGGFVATKATLAGSGPLWANAIRFLLAIAVLAPVAGRRIRRLTRGQLASGALLGVFLLGAFSFQTAGMVSTSVAHSSFITCLYAVLVPLLGPFFGRRPDRWQLAAAALATCGLLLLTGIAQAPAAPIGRGDWLVLGCAFVSAIHILIADRVSKDVDPIALNWVQLATVALLSVAAAWGLEGPPAIRWQPAVIGGQLYLAIFSSGVAFTLQFWAQRRISPTAAAMVFLLEAPFGALAGYLAYGEQLTLLQALGAVLMIGASYLAVAAGEKVAPADEIPLRETGL
jgi:drug/metabolite transporter (DMT)-like permease